MHDLNDLYDFVQAADHAGLAPTGGSLGNGMAEHLSRRLVAKCLPWPLVQLSRYSVELGL